MAASAKPAPIGPLRFRIRLSLRLSLLLATLALLAVGVGLGIGIPAYRQRGAIREIERVGGKLSMRPRGPAWLRDRIGEQRMKLFDEVIEVDLKRKYVQAIMGQIERLTGLQKLVLSEANVTDQDLAHLGKMTNLRTLKLDRTQVTNAGIAHLKELVNLEKLSLANTRVSDAGL